MRGVLDELEPRVAAAVPMAEHADVRIDDWAALARVGDFQSRYLHLPAKQAA